MLTQQLADARERREDFPSAWQSALEAALRGSSPPRERADWRHVLVELAESFRAAYELRPATAPERALLRLGPDVLQALGQPMSTAARASEAAYRRGLRATRRALRRKIVCACGCGRVFKPTRVGHVFYDDACRQRGHRNGRARVTTDGLA